MPAMYTNFRKIQDPYLVILIYAFIKTRAGSNLPVKKKNSSGYDTNILIRPYPDPSFK